MDASYGLGLYGSELLYGDGSQQHLRDRYADPQDVERRFQPDIGPLDTPEQRAAFLQNLTQNDPDNPQSAHYCGPTAILAAMVHANGMDGLKALIDHTQATREEGTDPNEMLAEIQKKLAEGGKINSDDIATVQQELYARLQEQQTKLAGGDVGDGGLHPKIIEQFVKSSPEMRRAFARNQMSIANVDTDGNGEGDHFVLNLNDETMEGHPGAHGLPSFSRVYDPAARKDGMQLNHRDVDLYQRSTVDELQFYDV